MAKFNFSNFKESLNGLTKRAKNIKVKRSDSSRYGKGKRSAASDQSLGWRIAKIRIYWTAYFLCSLCHRWW